LAWHLFVHASIAMWSPASPGPPGATRTETDFVRHAQQTVASDWPSPRCTGGDNLNHSLSAALVRWVAEDRIWLTGPQGQIGILKNLASRRRVSERSQPSDCFSLHTQARLVANQIESAQHFGAQTAATAVISSRSPNLQAKVLASSDY